MRKRRGKDKGKRKRERRLFEYRKSLQANKYVMMSCLSPRLEVSLFLWLLRISKMHQLVASLAYPLQDIREVSLSKAEAVNKYFSLFFSSIRRHKSEPAKRVGERPEIPQSDEARGLGPSYRGWRLRFGHQGMG